ncbi:MAG: gamma-glutamyltransferase [Planctomycetes bacterium]|nr:gamma-glutamyltransferase [Planctomycetota bacterium]
MNRIKLLLLLFTVAARTSNLYGADTAPLVQSKQGMVVSVNPEASDAGLQILQSGGNAVDAAVTVALALAVTFPEAGNIGGGGFMMVWPGAGVDPVCIEYRETCPAAVGRDTFLKENRQEGHHTVGVPGTVRGMGLAHQKYGRLPWASLVAPAIRLAQAGFPVDKTLASGLNRLIEQTGEFPEFRRVYGKADGSVWKPGDRLIQPDLAMTLSVLATDGPNAFYEGQIADKIVAEMKAGGGCLTHDDLAKYRPHVRVPVHTTYRSYDVFAPPPPSAGGTQLIECLNILERFDLAALGPKSPRAAHLLAESMRRAGCDRVRFQGDPEFTPVPARLVSKEHAEQVSHSIQLDQATRSEDLAEDLKLTDEPPSTTHFSVADGAGMAVANTYTLQNSYGSRVVVRGAGFLLNNEMTDFNWKPGVTTRAGQVGTEPNVMAPGKRMVSSQCPTFVSRDGRLQLITGSPGGRTIPSTVLCVLVNVLDFQMSIRDAVDAPRWHHQWFPDHLQFEHLGDPEYAEQLQILKQWKHNFGSDIKKLGDGYRRQGDAHSILIRDGTLYGASDWRRTQGKAAGW